ncbi:MAG TPA: AI-2E family transporter [Candidatus Polarisedimenticolaceae bacterium]|nr:AI-2E family transporter [Candidatus Polarisedimenticolaceae bacterium]
MNANEQRDSSRSMDFVIRVGLIGGLAVLCYQVLSPFLMLAVWSIILAVTLYPLDRWLARKVGKQWLASTLIVVIGVVLIVVPTALLMSSFADSIRGFIDSVQSNTIEIPAPRESVQEWPVVGNKIYGVWAKAYEDLPAFVQSMQPKIGELARRAVAMIASIGGGILLFLASFIVAGILMAYGEAGAGASRAIFRRVAGPARGDAFTKLSTATIRTVAQGVVGVAAIQAILIGIALLIAGIKVAGALAIVALVLGIAQVPALIVTLPVIIYIWTKGDYGTGAAITHTIVLLVTGMADNVLKPLLLGRGVDAPMPVILFGALGGMAALGIPGMFVGATGLALGYEIYREWVAADPT